MDEQQLARIAKFQKLWRSKRVFTNSQIGWKTSTSALTSKIVTFKLPTLFKKMFTTDPVGFSEVSGYVKEFKKPSVRWLPGRGWLGFANLEGTIKKVIAKRAQQTIVFYDDRFEVMGVGNFEAALLAIVKNGWAPKLLLKARPVYKKIDGIFYVNKPFDLDGLVDELRKLPSSLVEQVKPYQKELNFGVPTVVLKLKKPKWTYQFFKNGTVLFTGVKDPSDIDMPRQLFKEFFSDNYGLLAPLMMNLGTNALIGKPEQGNKMAKLANRYRLAASWNARPPQGFYVRPGTNGKPRLYKWRKMEKNVGSGEWVNRGAMNLSGVGPKVVKAFANAGVQIPAATLNAFRRAGHPLQNRAETPPSKATLTNRRAPGWNATKSGFYVRPGPGQQPYWFKVPEGIAGGRKTVIKTYAKAGRNIPPAVRAIFKIGNNITTAQNVQKHRVVMGLNGIIRVNNKQASRLTKAELLAVARNMDIADVNTKSKPSVIIQKIQARAGAHKMNRNFDTRVNGYYYKFIGNGRIERTTPQGLRTTRNWTTMPSEEQNKIAMAILPSQFHSEIGAMTKNDKYTALMGYAQNKRPKPKSVSPPKPKPKSPSPVRSPNADLREKYAIDLAINLENYRNGNENKFIEIFKKLPKGARGQPLKTTVTSAYKKFIKETNAARVNNAPKARYASRIQIPNWLPANKVNSYKKLLTNMAFQKPRPKVANMKAAVRSWLNFTVPQTPGRAAYEYENMTTGQIFKVPATTVKKRTSPVIPKRSPKAPKAKPKSVSPNKPLFNSSKAYNVPSSLGNLTNAMANLGLNVRRAYSWNALVRAGINNKFKKVWTNKIAKRT
jgi:hypothetical protein